jgi:hypothetical protein
LKKLTKALAPASIGALFFISQYYYATYSLFPIMPSGRVEVEIRNYINRPITITAIGVYPETSETKVTLKTPMTLEASFDAKAYTAFYLENIQSAPHFVVTFAVDEEIKKYSGACSSAYGDGPIKWRFAIEQITCALSISIRESEIICRAGCAS